MAITHVATAGQSAPDTTTSLTLTIPAGVQDGDILVVGLINAGAGDTPSVSDDDTGGNTWAMKVERLNGGSSENGSLWWKRATSGTASKTITATGFTDSCAGFVSAYRGCKVSGDPFDQDPVTEDNGSGDESMTGFTPTVDGCLVALAVLCGDNVEVFGFSSDDPGELAIRVSSLSSGGADSAASLGSEVQATAAATGNLTWTMTNRATISIGFALSPPVAAVDVNIVPLLIARARMVVG